MIGARPMSEESAPDIRDRMDRMYRPQTLIYDLTRKYYLLGRDRLIRGMGAGPGQTVLEIGCGTGRNLDVIGRRYPGTSLLGLDAAAPMLEVAWRRLDGRARLARGVAEELDLGRAFGRQDPVDHVVIAYTLSIVDDPVAVLRAGLGALAPGGTLHVVDFGDQAGLPAWFRQGLTAWLARFGTRHPAAAFAELSRLGGAEGAGRLRAEAVLGRYALLYRLERRRP